MVDIITRYYDRKIIMNRSVDIGCPVELLSKTALFYLHGGGWARGSKDQFHSHLEYFTNKGFFCASLGYRLVPEVRIKEQISDVIKGYDCCLSYIEEKKLNIDKVIIVGGSAGAHLASLVALNPPEFYDSAISLENMWIKPAGCISAYGPAFLTEWPDMNFHLRGCIEDLLDAKYGENEEKFISFSPIKHVDENSPPFLFLLAENEEFFPHEHALEMNEAMRQFNIRSRIEVFENTFHGFFYSTEGGPQQKALAIMEDFIDMISRDMSG